jgi:ATP-dependent Clp protease ATP-binding subunit ClpA
MLERFDDDARRRVMFSATEEARRRGDGRIGTEHLLLALLDDPGSIPARAVAADVESARAALDTLDRAALAAVGIEVAHVSSAAPVLTGRRPPLTSGARAVLKRAVFEARAAKARRIQARHLLLGVLGRERPDPAAELFAALGIDRAEVRERLNSLAR